jgi:hypothetical protein
VLVDGDPTKNIEDVRKVSAVITRGYLIYPQEIDAALGIAPFVERGAERDGGGAGGRHLRRQQRGRARALKPAPQTRVSPCKETVILRAV